MLLLSKLNALLRETVTEKEHWILDQEQNNGMDLRDVLLHLDPYKLSFGVVQLGSQRSMQIYFRNTESCALLCLGECRNHMHGAE
jgi:hypothetical protein